MMLTGCFCSLPFSRAEKKLKAGAGGESNSRATFRYLPEMIFSAKASAAAVKSKERENRFFPGSIKGLLIKITFAPVSR
jgi:hypothetical protein